MDIKRIALLIPHTDITLETDLRLFLDNNFIIHTQRMFLEDVSKESEEKMVNNELPKSINYLKNITNFDGAIFGCTSASVIYGNEGLKTINNIIKSNLNCKSITAYEGVINEIKKRKVKNISLLSPYTEEVNNIMAKQLIKEGIKVEFMKGLNLLKDKDISNVEPNLISKFILDNKKEIEETDLCFISCTNFRSTEVLKDLNNKFNTELISSNSSIINYLKNFS